MKADENPLARWSRRRRRLELMSEVLGPVRGPAEWVREAVMKRRPPLIQVEVRGATPVSLRLGSRDLDTFKQVVMDDEYTFSVRHQTPRTIVDAGANIGLATVLLAARYPSARIVAIEPDPGNFALLERNVASLPNVTPLCAALVAHAGNTVLTDPGVGEWGFRIDHDAADGKVVRGVDVPWLLEHFELSQVDLFKIDIEGAEKEVFESARGWIDKVNVVIAELHDRFAPGCSRAFFSATSGFEVEEHRGENILVCRRSFLSS